MVYGLCPCLQVLQRCFDALSLHRTQRRHSKAIVVERLVRTVLVWCIVRRGRGGCFLGVPKGPVVPSLTWCITMSCASHPMPFFPHVSSSVPHSSSLQLVPIEHGCAAASFVGSRGDGGNSKRSTTEFGVTVRGGWCPRHGSIGSTLRWVHLWSGVEWSGVEWSGVEWSGVVACCLPVGRCATLTTCTRTFVCILLLFWLDGGITTDSRLWAFL